MKENIGILMILFILILTSNVQAEVVFKDVSINVWYYEDMHLLVGKNVVAGYADGTFKPNSTLTKDAFIKLVVTAMGYTNIKNANDYWAKNFINKAIELKLISAGPDYNIYKKEITREEVADIVINALDENYGGSVLVSRMIKDFNDVRAESKENVSKIFYKGIITGYKDKTYRPKGILTRAEAIAIISRVINENKRVYVESLMESEIRKIQAFSSKLERNKNASYVEKTLGEMQKITNFITFAKKYAEDLTYNINVIALLEDDRFFEKTFNQVYKDENRVTKTGAFPADEYKQMLYTDILKSENRTVALFETEQQLLGLSNEGNVIVRGKLTCRSFDYISNIQVGQDSVSYLEIEIGFNKLSEPYIINCIQLS